MTKRFDGLKAKNYVFIIGDTHRYVVALYGGAKRIGFIEYDDVERFTEMLMNLKREHDERDSAQSQELTTHR